MNRLARISGLCVVVVGLAWGSALFGAPPEVDDAAREHTLQLFNASPAAFIENAGQIDDPTVRYAFYGNGASIFHTTNGPVFQVFQREKITSPQNATGAHVGAVREPPSDNFITYSYAFSATFPGAKRVMPTGADLNRAKVNYYIGKNANNWRTNVATYATVVYPGLYDGIDLYTYGRRTHLKYEFHVAPGADYNQIMMRYEGIDGLSIDANGALHIQTPLGELVDEAPYIYQVINGRKKEVAGRYRVMDQSSYNFQITGKVDAARELIIDPYLAWGSFLGGSSLDRAYGIAADADGNAFITGYTESSDFPTPGGFDTTCDGREVFIAKVSVSGELQWATFMGGSNWEEVILMKATAWPPTPMATH